jgi:hypothetical protein
MHVMFKIKFGYQALFSSIVNFTCAVKTARLFAVLPQVNKSRRVICAVLQYCMKLLPDSAEAQPALNACSMCILPGTALDTKSAPRLKCGAKRLHARQCPAALLALSLRQH